MRCYVGLAFPKQVPLVLLLVDCFFAQLKSELGVECLDGALLERSPLIRKSVVISRKCSQEHVLAVR